jgi:hypothetical protein
MLVARARLPFISTPPQVATFAQGPPAPDPVISSTTDFRIYPIIGAGGSIYIFATPPFPPNTTGPNHACVAREIPALPYPGSAYIAVSRQLYYLRGNTLIASQQPFTPPSGSAFSAHGGVFAQPFYSYIPPLIARDNPPPPYSGSIFSTHALPDSQIATARPPLVASTQSPLPHPGSTFIDIGGTVSTPPRAPSPTIASTPPPPPYPGGTFFRIGSGDLNPTRPQPTTISRTDDFPATLRGSSTIVAQKTNTIIQTPPPIVAAQSYVPLHPGASFTAHAAIDNGQHRLQPLIAIESPRPYPLGSTFSTHGPPDNGLLYPRPVFAIMSSADTQAQLAATGSVWMLDSSQLNPGPTLQIISFTVDLAQIVPFTLDMGEVNQ